MTTVLVVAALILLFVVVGLMVIICCARLDELQDEAGDYCCHGDCIQGRSCPRRSRP